MEPFKLKPENIADAHAAVGKFGEKTIAIVVISMSESGDTTSFHCGQDGNLVLMSELSAHVSKNKMLGIVYPSEIVSESPPKP